MINKKNLLGKRPIDLGVKDAIHTAIVSVRAGSPIKPGERCGLNEFNEAIPRIDGVGIADPWLPSIAKGESFWLMLNQDEVPNVAHVWEHPTVDFSPPTRDVVRNKWLLRHAEDLGITYEQLMDACAKVVETGIAVEYPGTKSVADLKVDRYDIFSTWADETGHEFPNYGTECCPEYEYPRELFAI